MNLKTTRIFLVGWYGCVKQGEYLDDIEQKIREHAEVEWGVDTRVSFDREKRTALVRNVPKGLILDWCLEKETLE